jgi:DNA-binding MarR family transcriptional regulator
MPDHSMPLLLLKDLPRYECLLEAAREFPDLDPSAAEAFLHLLRASDEAYGINARNMAAHGISAGRFSVLMLLWRGDQVRSKAPAGAGQCDCGPRTPASLADACGVTRATMTGLIDTLERDGFVKREPDPADRRMMSVHLTPKAEGFLRDYMPGHFKIISAIMSVLTEPERKTLVRLLVKVQQQAATLAGTPQAAST